MLIFKQMAAILSDINAITKGRTNSQGASFKYRGIDDIYNELHGSFAKYDVFCTTNILERSQIERQSKSGGALFYTTCKIQFTFYAADGSNVSSTVIGEAMDSGDKGTNKCMAIAHKYALLQAFLVPTEEEKDPDGQIHNVTNFTSPMPKPIAPPIPKPIVTVHCDDPHPTRSQLEFLLTEAKKARGWTPTQITQVLQRVIGVDSSKDLSPVQYKELFSIVTKKSPLEVLAAVTTEILATVTATESKNV